MTKNLKEAELLPVTGRGYPKVRNWLNRDETDSTQEAENTLPSMTVPDLTMSVAELVKRQEMGLPFEGERIPIYDEENDMPDLTRLDLVERQQYIKFYSEQLKEIGDRKAAADAAAKDLEDKKLKEAEFEAKYRQMISDQIAQKDKSTNTP